PALIPLIPADGPVLQQFSTPAQIQLIVADDLMCPACPLPRIVPNPLLGTWYRDMGGLGVVVVTFTHDEMKVCLSQRETTITTTITVTAHYTITEDGLVYGAFTGADVDAKSDGTMRAAVGMEIAELSLVLQELSDRPFSFRTK